ncbi:MAG: Asp23/Gls24 family envelope stress response protein [Firmicutes bacterium]|nr:Asp23/Gls24 family envelope stress response protein [Bacillota bacterium]
MADENTTSVLSVEEGGTTRIADDVIAQIAALAVRDVEGVSSMNASFVEGIVNRLGRQNAAQGVRVNHDGESISIALSVVARYPVPIPKTVAEMRNRVYKDLEALAGLHPTAVDIYVEGLQLPEDATAAAPDVTAQPAES